MKKLLVTVIACALMAGFSADLIAQQAAVAAPQNKKMRPRRGLGQGPTKKIVTGEVKVNTLSATSFVVVKDLEDHQIIIIYQIDDKGKVSQTDKKKFYY